MSWLKEVDDGFIIPSNFPDENYYLMKNMVFHKGDIVLSTYPKCGTNWVAYIIWGILHPKDDPPDGSRVLFGDIPLVEFTGLCNWTGSEENEPRTLCTHLSPKKMVVDDDVKYVVVMRNPMDCCVSFYHFFQTMWHTDMAPEDNRVPEKFVNLFVTGEIPFGDFFDHALLWYDLRERPNVHILTYEELTKDAKGEILKLAQFLGRNKELEMNDGSLLKKLVNQSSFSFMKKNLEYKMKLGNGTEKHVPVVRKGQVGSYSDELSEKHAQMIRDKMENTLKGTTLLELWRDV